MAQINSDRTNRSVVPQPRSQSVCVLPVKTDMLEDIAAVIERHHSEILVQRDRNPELGIDDQQLPASLRNGNQRTRALHTRSSACLQCSLWTRAIQRKTTQRAATAGKELLAKRHMAAVERFFNPNSKTVRPDHIAWNFLVVGILRQQFGEVDARSQAPKG